MANGTMVNVDQLRDTARACAEIGECDLSDRILDVVAKAMDQERARQFEALGLPPPPPPDQPRR